MRFVFVLAILVLRAVFLTVPGAIWRKMTGRYTSVYRFGGRSVVRPVEFASRPHMIAFEDVGNYLGDSLSRDVMLGYEEGCLSGESISLRPKGIPVEVWRDVLFWFHGQGIIELFWVLKIPTDLTPPSYARQAETWTSDTRTPLHGPDGVWLEQKEGAFTPGLLTGDEKQELLGTSYRVHPDALSCGLLGKNENPLGMVILEEKHFSRLYRRPKDLLDAAAVADGAKRLRRGLIWTMLGSGK